MLAPGAQGQRDVEQVIDRVVVIVAGEIPGALQVLRLVDQTRSGGSLSRDRQYGGEPRHRCGEGLLGGCGIADHERRSALRSAHGVGGESFEGQTATGGALHELVLVVAAATEDDRQRFRLGAGGAFMSETVASAGDPERDDVATDP